MEANTLSGKPRKIMSWAWAIMMVLAALVAIGSAFFG
jgi:hypothetical protein